MAAATTLFSLAPIGGEGWGEGAAWEFKNSVEMRPGKMPQSTTRPLHPKIFTLNSSPFFNDCANAASNSGMCSKSFKLTTSTGECI